MPGPAALTDLLQAWHEGSEDARDRVFDLTYGELRAVAAGYLRRERWRTPTLQVTVLVHEAFLRLVGTRARWADRGHFYGVAAQAMRRVLVDHARRRRARKRHPGLQFSLEHLPELAGPAGFDALALNDALADLERLDPRQARVVELRCFGGLTVEETAEALGLSPATVKREWSTARAWISRQVRRHARTP